MRIITFLFICITYYTNAQPIEDNHIKIDQFGYVPSAQKIAVISNPQTGYNSNDQFTPGTAYEVRKWSDNNTVFSGNIVAWNNGVNHLQSGDKVWWFDFSTLTAPGTYYIYDVSNNKRSYPFVISNCVYQSVLKQAMRAFYYQRCGVSKSLPNAESPWTDNTACHVGTQQDHDCRLVSNTNSSTSKDLWGGWHDAGDYNKYIPFTFSTMTDLLLAYEENPNAWDDNYNIPESGNGKPDLLDEIKFELDWMLRMQQSNGSILHKISVTSFESASPPSADPAYRRYASASTTATLTGAAIFALASVQYNAIGMTTYADSLKSAAINAWNWANNNPNVVFSNTGFQNADAEVSSDERFARKVCAAAYLFKATGNNTYKTFFDNNYQQIHLMQWGYAYPFECHIQDGLLYYTKIPNATASVANNIKNTYTTSMETSNPDNLPAYLNKTDAYRAYMSNQNYTWGNNQNKCQQGIMFLNMDYYNLDTNDSANYKNAAFGFLHYLHGVNPTAYCYLSNMNSRGAEFSLPEIYHGWFNDGTNFDNVNTSNGPAPAFMPGGANPNYSPDAAYSGPAISPPQNQPIQKSFKAWNTGWPENSWELSEIAIYTQAAYVRLLSRATAYNPSPAACICNNTTSIIGNNVVCNNQSSSYSTPTGPAGCSYIWTITGGVILSGQGTDTIKVQWNNNTIGNVSVEVKY